MDDMTELARAVASLRIRERQALGAMLKVWRLRATMTQTKVAEVTGLRRDRVSMVEGGRVCGAVTQSGLRFSARAVVLTAGTFLDGRVHIGLQSHAAGREL
jgi:tRNA U34 5-carboxymethylaminomethyl modifying enzyme MnmG/GidA